MAEIRQCCTGQNNKPFLFKIFLSATDPSKVIAEGWSHGVSLQDAADKLPNIYPEAVKAIELQTGEQFSYE